MGAPLPWLIARIKGDITDLSDPERAQVDEAVTVIRKHRAVSLGMPSARAVPPSPAKRGPRMTATTTPARPTAASPRTEAMRKGRQADAARGGRRLPAQGTSACHRIQAAVRDAGRPVPGNGRLVGDPAGAAFLRARGGAGVRPHGMRHAAARTLLAGGATMEEIGQLLRHAQERTTAIYANPRELHPMRDVCAA